MFVEIDDYTTPRRELKASKVIERSNNVFLRFNDLLLVNVHSQYNALDTLSLQHRRIVMRVKLILDCSFVRCV